MPAAVTLSSAKPDYVAQDTVQRLGSTELSTALTFERDSEAIRPSDGLSLDVTWVEQRIGRPVITSNQASYWRILHHAGRAPPPSAPGRHFSFTLPGNAA